MEIIKQDQYNESIGRYKLLSSNAGVGSIVTSSLGYYILISDVLDWKFIHTIAERIRFIRCNKPELEWYLEAQNEINNELGLDIIEDQRLIEFLKQNKNLKNLLVLISLPHLNLNESFNNIDFKNSAINKKLEKLNIEKKPFEYTINASHFPQWFYNKKGELKKYQDWKKTWKNKNLKSYFFVPPRDANNKSKFSIRVPNPDGSSNEISLHEKLIQTNLALICEKGHLSDIPWPKYLRLRTEKKDEKFLFSLEDCCPNPKLKWSENKNKSEGFGSIYIECQSCHSGSGMDAEHPKINLEGITNLKPSCNGNKPWIIDDDGKIAYDNECLDNNGNIMKMQFSLVTGNSVYYANTFSSLFIPLETLTGITKELLNGLNICNKRYEIYFANKEISKEEYFSRKIDEDFVFENNIKTDDPKKFINDLHNLFTEDVTSNSDYDIYKKFRIQEYNTFLKKENNEDKGYTYFSVPVPSTFNPYFEVIKRVEELCITTVQLGFTRIKPNERYIDKNNFVVDAPSMNIYSCADDNLFVLPAVENYGEGIFIKFNEKKLNEWLANNDLFTRMSIILPETVDSNWVNIQSKLKLYGPKYLLIHTFSHLFMKELEFTCGYPTASLKERLFISEEMCGFLIYTVEGSEGSMGGLISQTEEEQLEEIFLKALRRAQTCSSDPLCWESDGQGVFNMNLASCFSCSLVSETSCEEMNIALDRRFLLDEEFGFFKNLEI